VIHVAFSSSGAGSLRQALRIRDQRKKVVDLTDHLSWGPIGGGNFVERENWLNANLPWDTNSQSAGEGWDWIATGAKDFLRKLESTDEHLVWVAPQNADELCGLHWYLDRFGGGKASFIVVDHALPGTWQGQAPKGIGELGPEQFKFLLENADRESWDEKRFPRYHWAHLCTEAANVRIVNGNLAKNVPDEYFDEVILVHCSTKWKKLHRVVADTMISQWDMHHYGGYDCLLWRLRELAKQRKIITNREILFGAEAANDPVLIRLGD
jgi:Protein of unknown function/Domain of unknown function (DUF1835)